MENVKLNPETEPTSMSICQMPSNRGNMAEILAVVIGFAFLVICKDNVCFCEINPRDLKKLFNYSLL